MPKRNNLLKHRKAKLSKRRYSKKKYSKKKYSKKKYRSRKRTYKKGNRRQHRGGQPEPPACPPPSTMYPELVEAHESCRWDDRPEVTSVDCGAGGVLTAEEAAGLPFEDPEAAGLVAQPSKFWHFGRGHQSRPLATAQCGKAIVKGTGDKCFWGKPRRVRADKKAAGTRVVPEHGPDWVSPPKWTREEEAHFKTLLERAGDHPDWGAMSKEMMAESGVRRTAKALHSRWSRDLRRRHA